MKFDGNDHIFLFFSNSVQRAIVARIVGFTIIRGIGIEKECLRMLRQGVRRGSHTAFGWCGPSVAPHPERAQRGVVRAGRPLIDERGRDADAFAGMESLVPRGGFVPHSGFGPRDRHHVVIVGLERGRGRVPDHIIRWVVKGQRVQPCVTCTRRPSLVCLASQEIIDGRYERDTARSARPYRVRTPVRRTRGHSFFVFSFFYL